MYYRFTKYFGNKVVISDFNNDRQVAMLSLPSLGLDRFTTKIKK